MSRGVEMWAVRSPFGTFVSGVISMYEEDVRGEASERLQTTWVELAELGYSVVRVEVQEAAPATAKENDDGRG